MARLEDKDAAVHLLNQNNPFDPDTAYTDRHETLQARVARLYTAVAPSSHTLDKRLTFAVLLSAIAGYILCLWIQPPTNLTSHTHTLPTVPKTSTYSSDSPAHSHLATTTTPITPEYVVPPKPDVKIIGLIFYGRPMFVNILDCYLRANLASNGGYLDEVHWIANTKHEADLRYLDAMVDEVEEYSRYNQTGAWSELWNHAKTVDPEAIFVKIDDDVVFIADDAIPRLVNTLIEHPEAFATGGHIINSPHSHFWAYHTNALLPYLPSPDPLTLPIHPSALTTDPANFSASSAHPFTYDWRASSLPTHAGTATPQHPYGTKFDWPSNKHLQHDMQTWLPIRSNTGVDGSELSFSARLWQTPAINSSWPNPRGGWTMFRYADEIESWQMGIQTHYSFLEHLENNQLWRYHLSDGSGSGLWDMQFERYSLNFMAVKAGKMAEKTLFMNDEVEITMGFTHEKREPWLVDTRAVVSHYSFGSQHEVLKTDVLARYLGLANERVCGTKAGGGRLRGWVESSMVRTGN